MLHGIQVPEEYDNSNWSKGFEISWLKCLEWTHSTGLISLQSKLRSLEFPLQRIFIDRHELRSYCRKYHKKDYYL
ncbi:MAG: IS110 family transposase, partial [Saprospiraceae bacterium]|nr:IS110 family transposase [Saprospiraceae bacterium]